MASLSHLQWMHGFTKRCVECLGIFVAFGCLNVGANDELIERGKQIFVKQWEHQSLAGSNQPGQEREAETRTSPEFLPGDGLGPMFNATSCEACHSRGGAAGVERNVTLLTLDPRSEAINNVPLPNPDTRAAILDLYPGLLSPGGVLAFDVVVHEKSARPFFDPIRQQVGRYIPGGAPDEWFVSSKRTAEAIANQPVLAGRAGKLDFYLSQRNSPPLFGLGVMDRIDRSRLAVFARSQFKRTRGRVSGRVGAGIFGWRAQTPTLDQFVRGACAGEVGLQLGGTPQPPDMADETYVSQGVDLQEPEVNMLVSYVRSLPAPRQVIPSPDHAEQIYGGRKLFGKIGCVTCHIETIHPARGIY
ncbi:MAG: hypothetical protein MI861_03055, partial [Pirellulales bacterium]|nr:hypothetical protein [Pirellulales bacterium]